MIVGSWYYFKEDDLYCLFKVLEAHSELLAHTFWPSSNLPNQTNLSLFDTKSTCEPFVVPEGQKCILILEETVSEHEQFAIEQFKKIQAGLTLRKQNMQRLQQEVDTAYLAEQWNEVIEKASELALYSKYSVEIYEKRGVAYFMLEDYTSARYDFDFVLASRPTNESIQVKAAICNQKLQKKGNS